MSDRAWFEVRATVKVLAHDENDAINRVAAGIRCEKVDGVFAVGTFDARPTDDPTRRRTYEVGS